MVRGPASPLQAAEASPSQGIAQVIVTTSAVFLSRARLQRALEPARIPARGAQVVPSFPVPAQGIAPLRCVADALCFTRVSSNYSQCCVAGASGGGGGGSGSLPGLSATQSAHARAIIAEAKKEGLGHQGCMAGITTGLTEVCYIHPSSPFPSISR